MFLRTQSIRFPLGLFSWHYHVNNYWSHFVVFFHSLHVMCPCSLTALTRDLALTASSDLPSSLMVTSNYLNLVTCLRLVPWLSMMFAFVPLLLLTITSVFQMLTLNRLFSHSSGIWSSSQTLYRIHASCPLHYPLGV